MSTAILGMVGAALLAILGWFLKKAVESSEGRITDKLTHQDSCIDSLKVDVKAQAHDIGEIKTNQARFEEKLNAHLENSNRKYK